MSLLEHEILSARMSLSHVYNVYNVGKKTYKAVLVG